MVEKGCSVENKIKIPCAARISNLVKEARWSTHI